MNFFPSKFLPFSSLTPFFCHFTVSRQALAVPLVGGLASAARAGGRAGISISTTLSVQRNGATTTAAARSCSSSRGSSSNWASAAAAATTTVGRAGKRGGTGDRVWLSTIGCLPGVVVDADQDAGVGGAVGSREADKV